MRNLEHDPTRPQASKRPAARRLGLDLKYCEPDGIRATREALGLTQAQLAAVLGCHPMTVSTWERGVRSPSAYEATILLRFHNAIRRLPGGRYCPDLFVSRGPVEVLTVLLHWGGIGGNDGLSDGR